MRNKIISFILVICILFLSCVSLFGCKKKRSSEATNEPTETNAEFTEANANHTEENTPPSETTSSPATADIPLLLTTVQENEMLLAKLDAPKVQLDDDDIYDVMLDSVLCYLLEKGYDAFKSWAIVDSESNSLVPGVAYTNYQEYGSTAEGKPVYACGFYQFVFDNDEIAINETLVKQGMFVLPCDSVEKEGVYVISIKNQIPSASGVFNGKYFIHSMINDYTILFQVCENNRKYWNEDVDLYDFDNGKYIYRANLDYTSVSAISLYEDEYQKYCVARSAYEQIVKIQNENAVQETQTCVLIFSEDIIRQYIQSKQIETLNNIVLEKLKSVELQEGQYIMISSSGVEVKYDHETEERLLNDRLTNGIINSIIAGLTIAGSVYAVVASFGSATPAAIVAITCVTATSATVYGVSNLCEGVQDIYYSVNEDYTTPSYNPVLKGFKAAIKDDEVATTVYHVWGISNAVVANLSSVAGQAAGAAIAAEKSIALAITRASVVTMAKLVVVSGVSIAVNQGVIHLVESTTGNIYAAKIAGCVSAIAVAFFVGGQLDKLDKLYNISYNRSDYQRYAVARAQSRIVSSVEKNPGLIRENKEIGNYGEMKMDVELQKAGFKKVSSRNVTSLNQHTETGIDGVYYNKGSDTYLILDAKAGKGAHLGQTLDGKQMSKSWVLNRLKADVGESNYNAILHAWSEGRVALGVCKVNTETFQCSYQLLDENAMIVQTVSSPLQLVGAN